MGPKNNKMMLSKQVFATFVIMGLSFQNVSGMKSMKDIRDQMKALNDITKAAKKVEKLSYPLSVEGCKAFMGEEGQEYVERLQTDQSFQNGVKILAAQYKQPQGGKRLLSNGLEKKYGFDQFDD